MVNSKNSGWDWDNRRGTLSFHHSAGALASRCWIRKRVRHCRAGVFGGRIIFPPRQTEIVKRLNLKRCTLPCVGVSPPLTFGDRVHITHIKSGLDLPRRSEERRVGKE